MEGLSEQLFYVSGFGGNFIVLDRAKDLVVVTRWLEPFKIGGFLTLVQASLR